ncbi:MAG: PAS domain-containing protein [Chloroflexi bacterium]|nr:PAS domain-containing protein [Chloroflexota bacterium]
MNWQYIYTPYLWPMLATAVFISLLAVYAWRRRSVPGALPLSMMMLFGVLWEVGAALELAAVDIPTKIFWYKSIIAVCLMPLAIARFCFVLEYAGLGRLLTRRNLVLLSIPPLLQFLLAFTNDIHHWMWFEIEFDGTIRPSFGVGSWILTGFGYLLFLVNLMIFAGLFYRSPSHRWPVALILCSMLITHTFYLLDFLHRNPLAPLDYAIVPMNIGFIIYSLALFRFHMFDPIPAARKTAIEQMREGMLVLDTGGKIVDLNPAAENILSLPATGVRGRDVAEVLPACAGLSVGEAQSEIRLRAGDALRHYELSLSPLKDRSEVLLGHLLLLHDVTAQKQAQAQLLEQQRALAMLSERERLAGELHDDLGQVLAFINAQGQAVHRLLARGEVSTADEYVARLVEAAHEADTDLRESIRGLRVTLASLGLIPSLQDYLQRFEQRYGIQTEIILPEVSLEGAFEPVAEAQILRILQEGLTNARKHANARCVQVVFSLQDTHVQIVIRDDGQGFEPAALSGSLCRGFGLQLMRERAENIGGTLEVRSAPGEGTQVTLTVPRPIPPAPPFPHREGGMGG